METYTYTNYIDDKTNNILSTEETCLLETIINKLAVSGTRQYNTQAATILFKKWFSLSEDCEKIRQNPIRRNPIQEIKDNLKFLDDYAMEMQGMLRSKPIVTNLEKIRQYIDIINTQVSELE